MDSTAPAPGGQTAEFIGGYRVHPAASIFPLLEGEEFNYLCESIRTQGVLHPIIVRGDELIDGRNRLRAVEHLRADGWRGSCPVTQWRDDGRNVAEFIHAANIERRHLTPDAAAMASAAIFPLIQAEAAERRKATQFAGKAGPGRGKKTVTTDSSEPFRDRKADDARSTIGQIAKKANTSMHKARQAVAVQKAVAAGELPEEAPQEVMSGKKKLRDVLPKVSKAPATQSHGGIHGFEVHPALQLIPRMSTPEIIDLANDIKKNGQQEPVVLWNGQLIDGRNRVEACRRLGREPIRAELDFNEDPIAYIRSANLCRVGVGKADRQRFDAAIKRLRDAAEGGAA